MDNSSGISKRARLFGKIISAVLLILGLYCLLGIGVPVIKNSFPLEDGFEVSHVIGMLILLVPTSIFGVYCFIVACRLYKNMTKEALRNVCFISSLIFYFFSASAVVHTLGIKTSSSGFVTWFTLTELLCMIPAGLFYWLINKYTIKWLGFDTSIDWQRRKKALKSFFSLMAFLMMICMMTSFNFKEKTSCTIESPLWSLGSLLVPAALAFIFYGLAMRIVTYVCLKKQDPPDQPGRDGSNEPESEKT